MESSLYFFISIHLLFLISCSNLTVGTHSSSSSLQHMCHDEESFSLIQFKQSFLIDESASGYSYAYPKVSSWTIEEDCCSWDGIQCDNHTGHVIGLDLSSSFLYGSINSNSTIFNLVHLQSLNLADNNFNYSQIPSGIRRLSRLTSLNLSRSLFFGQIPSELLELSKLAFLDLCCNVDPGNTFRLLELENPSLGDLAENLTKLQVLSLSIVTIPSTVPQTMANLSSISYLGLRDCGLFGNFPSGIFLLPNLQTLTVRFNPNLIGILPEFPRGSPMKVLRLGSTSFSGKLPESIGNLDYLNELDIKNCSFSGLIPSSVGNLIELTLLDLTHNYFVGQIPTSLSNLTQLTFLSLSFNNFSSTGTFSWIEKQMKLTRLEVSRNNLNGFIPSFLQNLTQLTYLDLSENQLTGKIPSWFGNLTQLTTLGLYSNQLNGPIPESIFKLANLNTLYLHFNNLSGTLEVEKFLKLKNLDKLQLSFNILSLLTTGSINSSLPKFKLLGLNSCNLSEFPKFLQYQDQMELLMLSSNNLHGQIPKWIFNVGKKSLACLELSANFLTGFELSPLVLPWENLRFLYLNYNLMQGSLPIPPFSTFFYEISNNSITGEIPPLVCKLNSLFALDLANNHLNGTIPECLSNFSISLTILNLQNNNLSGNIPQTYNKGSNLNVINLSQNQLDGPVPRSLSNCKMLKNLDLGNNHISDIFPFWLGVLPEMKILVLRHNKFYGTLDGPLTDFDFPKLRIIDISWNGFSGELPLKHFPILSDMKVQEDIEKSKYDGTRGELLMGKFDWVQDYSHTMTITNKGNEMFYNKIQSVFKAMDLSGNKFKGKIPESIGVLKGLQLLNLSNNALTGPIPTSLGNLTKLESLDLSQNELSGDIPQQLVQLTFLAVFNVSHNHLTGRIPKGNQFGTFGNSSFDGNSGLCGDPLSKKCENSGEIPSPNLAFKDEDSDFPSKLDWIIISLGYLSGTVVGVVVGHIVTTRYHVWFVRKFGKQPKWKRVRKMGRRN